jgi:hypothetical protein
MLRKTIHFLFIFISFFSLTFHPIGMAKPLTQGESVPKDPQTSQSQIDSHIGELEHFQLQQVNKQIFIRNVLGRDLITFVILMFGIVVISAMLTNMIYVINDFINRGDSTCFEYDSNHYLSFNHFFNPFYIPSKRYEFINTCLKIMADKEVYGWRHHFPKFRTNQDSGSTTMTKVFQNWGGDGWLRDVTSNFAHLDSVQKCQTLIGGNSDMHFVNAAKCFVNPEIHKHIINFSMTFYYLTFDESLLHSGPFNFYSYYPSFGEFLMSLPKFFLPMTIVASMVIIPYLIFKNVHIKTPPPQVNKMILEDFNSDDNNCVINE